MRMEQSSNMLGMSKFRGGGLGENNLQRRMRGPRG